jgi:hypothetical protein
MTTAQLILVFWFASAVLIAVVSNFVFIFWLQKRGVRVFLGLAGTPGYLDYVYFRWCKMHGQSPIFILFLRCLSLANVIVAAFVVIPVIISAGGK